MSGRVEVEGRHLRLNGERFAVRGTAYGRFAPRTDGARYPEPPRLRADLESIAATGLNTVRTFDVPPADFFDAAADVGLRVLVGLDYPDWRFEPFPDRSSGQRITTDGLAAVDRLFARVDDPAVVLAVSVGRVLPAELVRVNHPGAVADTLAAIVDRIHTLDPSVLATYTAQAGDELTTVDGCDLLSIVLDANCEETFRRALIRFQQARPARPLVVTDLNPPTSSPTAVTQARELSARLRVLDRLGCAGATVATWIGEPTAVEEPAGWRSDSLVTSGRVLKPLGRCVKTWARQDVKDLRRSWPRVSALVTTHNNESTIERCLSALEMSDYHDLEVIVCDEGSTDRTLARAARFPFDVLQPTRSDGTAAMAGLAAASGDIVAFVDADVVCHRSWPWFIALAFDSNDKMAVVSEHLVTAEGGDGSDGGVDEREVPGAVAHAVAALADLERLPSTRIPAAVGGGVGGLAVRRSALRSAPQIAATSAVAVGEHLSRHLAAEGNLDVIGPAPAAQAVRPAPHTLGAVWSDAVRRGGADRAFEAASTGGERRGRVVARLLSAALVGERPPRAVALRAVLDVLVPLLVGSAVLGAILLTAGAGGVGLLVFGTAVGAVVVPAALVSRDVAAGDRKRGAPRIAVAAVTAAVVVVEPLAHLWGRLWSRARPPAPTNRSWTGEREDWLRELRWRLGRAELSVFVPNNRNRWDIEVRCGLFLRKLIVAAVAWQWTPHARVTLRPRWLIVVPILAVAAAAPWSPMTAAFIASAAVGELAFELITLRRVDHVISRSITGSLPPVQATGVEPELVHDVELAARTTVDH